MEGQQFSKDFSLPQFFNQFFSRFVVIDGGICDFDNGLNAIFF
jgi:hypothetical protein